MDSPQNILKAKKAIKKAFRNQMEGLGFSIVEVLSQCPTYFGLSPEESVQWIRNNMTKEFPLGIFKDGLSK